MSSHLSTHESPRLSGRPAGSAGFTLLELMLALTLLAIVTGLSYLTFSTVASAWQRSQRMSDSLQHGDFLVEQLVMALRSAYCPEARNAPPLYGFWHEDEGGEGESASDSISWVKLGTALVGRKCRHAGTPHRVRFSLEEDESGVRRPVVRSWPLHGLMDDFDPELVEAMPLPGSLVGFNCRAAYQKIEDEIEWMDEWEQTNKLPTVVELTLYLAGEEGKPAIEIKRMLGIPVAPLHWVPR